MGLRSDEGERNHDLHLTCMSKADLVSDGRTVFLEGALLPIPADQPSKRSNDYQQLLSRHLSAHVKHKASADIKVASSPYPRSMPLDVVCSS